MFYLGISKKIEDFFKARKEQRRIFKDINTEYTTSLGYIVLKHNNGKFLVRSKDSNKFVDLRSSHHAWSPESIFFKDCVGSKEKVENMFGTINFPEPDNNA